jgi:starch-binding outer membrane protein, SusD/RagB family
VLTQAYLFAGYADRTLGENMCDAVFDGGPAEPYTKYFEKAQAHFTSAITNAPNTTAGTRFKNAAYAGRAATRVWLKDWAGAVADAKQVPVGFEYKIAVSLEDVKQNGDDLYWANANSPYRGYTLWGTWFETYYDQTGDARAAYGTSAAYPLAQQQLSGYGAVPWKFTTKYQTGFDHQLASYKEMLLIQAEALLTAGDIGGAMALINQVHTATKNQKTGANLAALATPANVTDAWTLLKRERALELYLQARRFGDLRRWKANNTPGAIDWPNFEGISKLFKDNPPSSCFPIPEGELNTNTNLG